MTDKSRVGKLSPSVYPQPTNTTTSIYPLIYRETLLAKEPKLVKIVIDTNVYLSGIIFGGSPRRVLKLAKDKRIRAFTSPSILLEIADKLNKKFKWDMGKVETVLKAISKITEVVHPQIKLEIIKDDPSDNKILECAVASNADYVVTGDKHLLDLKEFEGIKIVTSADFIKIISKHR